MANHPSAWKRIRQSEKRYERNKLYRGRMRTFIKRVREQIELKDAEGASKALREATVVIAKASSKGVIHSKMASRNISRLTRQVNALNAS
ncbi:MAG: 30S ribosomal protein S20 [Nitrospiraceae bacterium]|nr:30S ribosomal protein S20 [Nitrospiraceae bacterium]